MYLDGERIGPLFRRATERRGKVIRDAVRGAAQDAADEIETEGREDIASAGNFGSRWTDGFNAKVTEGGGSIRIEVSEEVPYWPVFEFGAIIQGRPLLYFKPSPDYAPLWDANGKPPLLISVKQVIEPQKFHLRDIIRKVVKRLPELFKERLAK